MNENIHNEIAQFAYRKVSEKCSGGSGNKEFRSLARSLPSMIQVNGLCGTVAFLYSKLEAKNSAHKDMYGIIDLWLKKIQFDQKENKEELMERLLNMDNVGYRIYTNEAMRLSLWIKRFAEGMIEE